jgi:glucokinase
MICLSGDIGASNSRLAILNIQAPASPVWLAQQVYINANFKNFEQVLTAFSETHLLKIETACFGVAGPVKNGQVTATNLPWTLSEIELSKFLNVQRTFLLNDLEAIAYGLPALKPEEILEILPGQKSTGNQAVIAPGSGIGEAVLFWDGQRHRPFATEGGHCTFSPTSALQSDLCHFLLKEHQHVSWERVLSGPGIFNIHRFLNEQNLTGGPQNSAELTERALAGDASCLKVIDLFFEILANEAGNLALKSLSLNGLFIAGGITPKLIKLMDMKKFAQNFYHKGRMSDLLKDIPVHLVLNDLVGILGAARFAQLNSQSNAS